jgi:hypothetical protein
MFAHNASPGRARLAALLATTLAAGAILSSAAASALASSPGDSGWLSPTVSVSGGQWATPDNAFASDNNYAVATGNSQVQSYRGFGISAPPAGSMVVGIEVSLEAQASTTCKITASLSWNAGSNYTSGSDGAKTTPALGTTDSTPTLGGTGSTGDDTNTWGRVWSPDELTGTSFVVRVQSGSCPSGTRRTCSMASEAENPSWSSCATRRTASTSSRE